MSVVDLLSVDHCSHCSVNRCGTLHVPAGTDNASLSSWPEKLIFSLLTKCHFLDRWITCSTSCGTLTFDTKNACHISKIASTAVTHLELDEMGEINDFIIDWKDGDVAFAVLHFCVLFQDKMLAVSPNTLESRSASLKRWLYTSKRFSDFGSQVLTSFSETENNYLEGV